MPRTGGVYSPPAGTKGTPNTTIQSVPYNTWVDDLTADANAARPITAGGTGATSASAARTALGVAIGSDVQAYDAGLQSIAGLTTAADRMIYTTASDVYATTALTPFARTVLDDADASTVLSTLGVSTFMKTVLDDVDAATARATLGVTIGTNVQAFDAGLQSIAGLTTAANQMIYTTALDAYATTALTAFARTILDDADAATVRATIGANDANNLTAGTVADARLPATMSPKTITGTLTVANPSGNSHIEIGRTDAITSALIDFHSSGNNIDYDARIIATGGNASIGQGGVNILSSALLWNSNTLFTTANDGAGSGLDADLLDGQQGSFYQNLANATGTLADARLPTSMAGKTFTSTVEIEGGAPILQLTETDAAKSWFIVVDGGNFSVRETNTATTRFSIAGGASASGITYLGNVVWNAGNDGAGSGLDADLLDGQQGSFYQNLANSTGTLPNARVSGAYDGITTLGQTGLHTITTTGEAIRVASPDTTSDPFVTFYKTTTRQSYIQHTDGAGTLAGFKIVNDLPSGDTQLILNNDGGVDGLRYVVGASNNAVWHDGQGGGAPSSSWVKFPNGLILQTGSSVVTTNGGGGGTIFFPTTFPTACNSVVGVTGDTAVAATDVKIATPLAGNGFSFTAVGAPSQAVRVNWMAWGY